MEKIIQIAGDGKFLYGLRADGSLVRVDYLMEGPRWMEIIKA